jgi:hypothetical protein
MNPRDLEPSCSTDVLVGPLLRYVGATTATIWVETTKACEVAILGHRAHTFHVEGHHYALVLVEGLESETATPYTITLDNKVVWPKPEDDRPAPCIRTSKGQRRCPPRLRFMPRRRARTTAVHALVRRPRTRPGSRCAMGLLPKPAARARGLACGDRPSRRSGVRG